MIHQDTEPSPVLFVENHYHYTLVTNKEISALIYEVEVGGKRYYKYGYFVRQKGRFAHVTMWVEPFRSNWMVDSYVIVGYINTHPYSSQFSQADTNNFDLNMKGREGCFNAYIACKNRTVIKYDPTIEKPENGVLVGEFTMQGHSHGKWSNIPGTKFVIY